MGKNYIFSSESVGEGHPDKVSDTISDAVLDACLAQDRRSRVACETLVKSNVVCLGGEITTKAKFDIDQVVRDAIREIADYVDTAAVSRQWSASANHAQVGDPVRAAKAIVDVAHMQDPPIRLALGSDCYARLRKKFATLNDDLAQWRSTTLSTDYRGPEGA